MRRVRILTSFASPDGLYQAGSEYDMPEGADWVRAGLAAYVDTSSPSAGSAPEQTEPPMLPQPRRRHTKQR